MSCVSRSILAQNQEKRFRINKSFNTVVAQFKQKDVFVFTGNTKSGVFGTVSQGFISRIQQKVAVKQFSERSTLLDVFVEAKITSHLTSLSGGIYFPFVYGVLNSKALLLEFIGEANFFSVNELGPTLAIADQTYRSRANLATLDHPQRPRTNISLFVYI